jgi:hypothetical protein
VALTAARRDRSSRRWPGASAQRRDAERVAFGDAVDFWRVTDVEHGRRLRLRAEMRLPGAAVLELVGSPEALRFVQEHTGEDRTGRMQRYRERRVRALVELEVDGYVLKRASPSCGLFRVRVYWDNGVHTSAGSA